MPPQDPTKQQPNQAPRPMMDVAPARPQPAPTQPQQQPAPDPNAYGAGGFGTPNDGMQVSPEAPANEPNQPGSTPKPPKKKKGIIIAIVLAVLVVLALIAAAGYWYIQSNQTDPAPVTDTSVSTEVDDGRVGVDDVDATVEAIDTNLNSIDDSQDFGQSDLTDNSIGLQMAIDPNKEQVVLVDESGTPTGQTLPKLDAHHTRTPLHLAFSCYVFNKKGQLLVTKRAAHKKVWPTVWTNSLCGHPAPGEPIQDAITRRAQYELGCTLTDITMLVEKYIYKTPPYHGIIEHEFCPIFAARLASEIQPNPDEVSEVLWMDWQEFIVKAQADMADEYSWWCKDQLKLLVDHPKIKQFIYQFSCFDER